MEVPSFFRKLVDFTCSLSAPNNSTSDYEKKEELVKSVKELSKLLKKHPHVEINGGYYDYKLLADKFNAIKKSKTELDGQSFLQTSKKNPLSPKEQHKYDKVVNKMLHIEDRIKSKLKNTAEAKESQILKYNTLTKTLSDQVYEKSLSSVTSQESLKPFLKTILSSAGVEDLKDSVSKNAQNFIDANLLADNMGHILASDPEYQSLLENLSKVNTKIDNKQKELKKSEQLGATGPYYALITDSLREKITALEVRKMNLLEKLEPLKQDLLKDKVGNIVNELQSEILTEISDYWKNVGEARNELGAEKEGAGSLQFGILHQGFPPNLRECLLARSLANKGFPVVAPTLSNEEIDKYLDYEKFYEKFGDPLLYDGPKSHVNSIFASPEDMNKLENEFKRMRSVREEISIIEERLGKELAESNTHNKLPISSKLSDTLIKKVLFPGGVPTKFDNILQMDLIKKNLKTSTLEELCTSNLESVISSKIDTLSQPNELNKVLAKVLATKANYIRKVNTLEDEIRALEGSNHTSELAKKQTELKELTTTVNDLLENLTGKKPHVDDKYRKLVTNFLYSRSDWRTYISNLVGTSAHVPQIQKIVDETIRNLAFTLDEAYMSSCIEILMHALPETNAIDETNEGLNVEKSQQEIQDEINENLKFIVETLVHKSLDKTLLPVDFIANQASAMASSFLGDLTQSALHNKMHFNALLTGFEKALAGLPATNKDV